jgi:uncharacterized protein YciI
MYVVELTYIQPPEVVAEHRPAHREYLDIYYASGHFLVSGPQDPPVGGLIVAKAESEAELREILAKDPYAVHGVAEYRLIKFNAVKAAPVVQEFVGL